MKSRTIPGLNQSQSGQARALLDQILIQARMIASGNEVARRRALKYLINRNKVHLDGVSAPKKVQLSRLLRERQKHCCPVCGKHLPSDPDAVEKHRLNRNGGYNDPSTIELSHRYCHRSEHAASDWS